MDLISMWIVIVLDVSIGVCIGALINFLLKKIIEKSASVEKSTYYNNKIPININENTQNKVYKISLYISIPIIFLLLLLQTSPNKPWSESFVGNIIGALVTSFVLGIGIEVLLMAIFFFIEKYSEKTIDIRNAIYSNLKTEHDEKILKNIRLAIMIISVLTGFIISLKIVSGLSFGKIIDKTLPNVYFAFIIGAIIGTIIHYFLAKFGFVKGGEKKAIDIGVFNSSTVEPDIYDKKEFRRTAYTTIILVFLFFSIKSFNLGSTQIGNMFENYEYQEQYYVYMYPDKNGSKNYKIKADIYKRESEYYIEKAYFENGGYITFDEWGYGNPLYVGEKIHLTDDSDNEWYVELTKEKGDN